jgi:ABC-type multidrug transport system fused ATPase/permease subunit
LKEKPDAVSLPAVRGHNPIRKHVVFGYELEPAGVARSRWSIPETLAIVGTTGAGKTPLVNLMPRFFDPWEGRVLIDRRDVRDVSESLRTRLRSCCKSRFCFR